MRAIAREPGRATHYANYVRLLLDQKRLDVAEPVIDRALRCATEQGLMGRLLADKSFIFAEQVKGEKALEHADAAIERGGPGIRAYYLRGRALALLGRLAEARRMMLKVLKLDPKNADALAAIERIDEAMP